MKWTSDSGREVEVEKREREARSTDGTDCPDCTERTDCSALCSRVVLQNPPTATVLFLHDPDTRS